MLKVKLNFTGSCLNQHTEEIHPTIKADPVNVNILSGGVSHVLENTYIG